MAFDALDNFIEIQKLKEELRAKSGNLVRHDVSLVAEIDGQTEFPIELSTFNYITDSILVVSGGTLLSSTIDYTVLEHSVILNEGVPVGRTVDIYVFKNVENLDTEKTIDGLQIAVGSIPLDRLEKIVATETFVTEQIAAIPECSVTSDVPMHFGVTESGGLRITYNDGN